MGRTKGKPIRSSETGKSHVLTSQDTRQEALERNATEEQDLVILPDDEKKMSAKQAKRKKMEALIKRRPRAAPSASLCDLFGGTDTIVSEFNHVFKAIRRGDLDGDDRDDESEDESDEEYKPRQPKKKKKQRTVKKKTKVVKRGAESRKDKAILDNDSEDEPHATRRKKARLHINDDDKTTALRLDRLVTT